MIFNENMKNNLFIDNLSHNLSKDILNDMELVELFLKNKSEGSILTSKVYKREIVNFLKYIDFPKNNLNSISVKLCIEYRDSLHIYKDATKARKLNTLSSLYKFGIEIGYLKYNPFKVIKKPKINITSQDRFLTKKELEDLLKELKKNSRNYLIGILLASCGLRSSELVSIQWKQFFEDSNGNIGLRIIGKGKKRRNVKIRKDVWSYILMYRISKKQSIEFNENDESFLILNKNNKPLSDRYCRKLLKETAKKIGINKEISTHWLRHTCATLAINGGADLKQCMDQFGWQDIKTAQRYIHSLNELEDAAADYVNIKI